MTWRGTKINIQIINLFRLPRKTRERDTDEGYRKNKYSGAGEEVNKHSKRERERGGKKEKRRFIQL